MHFLDLTLPRPAENLALDEALLDACEAGSISETLRFWESASLFVVVGYSNAIISEVKVDNCAAAGVPVLRRCSGGGTVIQGPGCLNYSLILMIDGAEELRTIGGANRWIMERQRAALEKLLRRPVQVEGHTDLALDGVKFSGNAQRRKRRALLFHGVFLLRFDIALMTKYLALPSHQPDYRANRPHGQFVTNISAAPDTVRAALREAWGASKPPPEIPDYSALMAEKYGREDWHGKF